MSINVYLTEDVRKANGFQPAAEAGGVNKFNGISLFSDKGPLYMMLGNEDDIVPAEIQPFVLEFSFYAFLQCERVRRELGIYNHESAEASVELQDNKKPNYIIKIRAKKIEDARELLKKFKTGTIRPTESYEGSQQGMSRQELEAELRRVTSNLENLRVEHTALHQSVKNIDGDMAIAQGRVRKIRQLANMLSYRRWQWPWCSKQAIATQIDLVLNDAEQSAA